MIFLLILVFLAIIAFEVPKLIRQQQWRELAAFGGLLVIAMVLSFGQVLGLRLPNPTRWIETIFDPVAEVVNKLLS